MNRFDNENSVSPDSTRGLNVPRTPATGEVQPQTTRCAPPDNDSGIGSNLALAMVYSPKQYWRCLYTPNVGLEKGTMFKELDLPFEGLKAGDEE